jgi:hypothetical protein
MKVRTYSWLLFSKRTPPAKKPLMSRVWWCSCHPMVKSCWVLVYSALLYKCCCRCCLALWDSTRLGAGMGGRGRVMASRMVPCDVYRCASLFIFRCFRTLDLYFLSLTMVCNNFDLIRVVLWTCLRVSFNAYVDPPYELQVIYQALTRQLTTGCYLTVA